MIDDWNSGPQRIATGDMYLDSGSHDLRVEYFNRTGDAVIHVWWEVVDADGDAHGNPNSHLHRDQDTHPHRHAGSGSVDDQRVPEIRPGGHDHHRRRRRLAGRLRRAVDPG